MNFVQNYPADVATQEVLIDELGVMFNDLYLTKDEAILKSPRFRFLLEYFKIHGNISELNELCEHWLEKL